MSIQHRARLWPLIEAETRLGDDVLHVQLPSRLPSCDVHAPIYPPANHGHMQDPWPHRQYIPADRHARPDPEFKAA